MMQQTGLQHGGVQHGLQQAIAYGDQQGGSGGGEQHSAGQQGSGQHGDGQQHARQHLSLHNNNHSDTGMSEGVDER